MKNEKHRSVLKCRMYVRLEENEYESLRTWRASAYLMRPFADASQNTNLI